MQRRRSAKRRIGTGTSVPGEQSLTEKGTMDILPAPITYRAWYSSTIRCSRRTELNRQQKSVDRPCSDVSIMWIAVFDMPGTVCAK